MHKQIIQYTGIHRHHDIDVYVMMRRQIAWSGDHANLSPPNGVLLVYAYVCTSRTHLPSVYSFDTRSGYRQSVTED